MKRVFSTVVGCIKSTSIINLFRLIDCIVVTWHCCPQERNHRHVGKKQTKKKHTHLITLKASHLLGVGEISLVIKYYVLALIICSFKKSFGCGSKSEGDKAAYQVMKDEYKKLGSISFAEGSVLLIFVLLVLLWFTREPGFMPGWATVLFNQDEEWVQSLTPNLFSHENDKYSAVFREGMQIWGETIHFSHCCLYNLCAAVGFTIIGSIS